MTNGPYAAALLTSLDMLAPSYVSQGREFVEGVNLTAGEVRIKIPPHLLGLHEDVLTARLSYSDPRGAEPLRELYLSGRGTTHLSSSSVVVTSGAKQAAWLAFMLLVQPGSKVALPRPGWAPYAVWASALGAEISTYDPLQHDAVQTICDGIAGGVDVVVLNSPNNPTGAELPWAAIEAIVAAATAAGAALLSDEVYSHFSEGGASLLRYVREEGPEVIVADSVSKWTAAAGLRIGFLTGPKKRIDQALALRSTIDSCPPGPTQAIAGELLGAPAAQFRSSLRTHARRTTKGLKMLLERNGIRVRSAGGLYVWAEAPAEAAGLRLYDGTVLRGVPGELFGAAGHLRLCPVTDDQDVLTLLEGENSR